MAAAKWPSPGLRNVGSYQVSGHPFITGSTNLDNGKVHMVEFPFVAKTFTVINTSSNSGEDIRVHFQSGSGAGSPVTAPGEHGAQDIANAQSDVIEKFHLMQKQSHYPFFLMFVFRFYVCFFSYRID